MLICFTLNLLSFFLFQIVAKEQLICAYTNMCVLYSDAINLYFTANHLQTAKRDPEDSV